MATGAATEVLEVKALLIPTVVPAMPATTMLPMKSSLPVLPFRSTHPLSLTAVMASHRFGPADVAGDQIGNGPSSFEGVPISTNTCRLHHRWDRASLAIGLVVPLT